MSHTFNQVPGETFSVAYSGAPPATGIVGTDLVTVGQVGPSYQAFGLNTTAATNLSSLPHQGILGMGAQASK